MSHEPHTKEKQVIFKLNKKNKEFRQLKYNYSNK